MSTTIYLNRYKLEKRDNLNKKIYSFITAEYISSRFESIHASNINDELYKSMEEKNYDIYGIHRDEKKITEYVSLNNRSKIEKIGVNQIVSSKANLRTIFSKMQVEDYLFIIKEDQITDIITLSDLRKEPARAYVYLTISAFEEAITNAIRVLYKKEELSEYLAENRMEQAKKRYDEQVEKNVDLDIYDCLELCDKNKLFRRCFDLEKLGFDSSKKYKSFYEIVKQIRNAISHSRDYVTLYNKNILLSSIIRIQEVTEKIRSEVLLKIEKKV